MGAAADLGVPADAEGHPDSPIGGKVYLGSYGEELWAKKHALDQAVATAVRWISTCRAILIGSGAGMGVDSGLGTYRGAKMGVWPPLKALGIDYREICTPDALNTDPQLTWAFWRYCMIAYQDAEPHEGYHIVQRWAAKARLGGFCYTTNVDSMWPRILPEQDVYEAHGSTAFLQCSDARGSCPGKGEVWACPEGFAQQLRLEESKDDAVDMAALPRCSACGLLVRPNVNMFGDLDFSKKRSRIQKARYNEWLQRVDDDLEAEAKAAAEAEEAADAEPAAEGKPAVDSQSQVGHQMLQTDPHMHPVVCLEIGAGTSIPTVRTALEQRAARPGHVLIRINPENFLLPGKLEAEGRAVAIALAGAEALRLIEERLAALC